MAHRRISLKYRVLAAVLLVLAPLAAVFMAFNARAVSQLDRQLAQANQTALHAFCTAVQAEIQDIEGFLNLLWGESEEFAAFAGAGADALRYEAAGRLRRTFAAKLDVNRTATLLAVYDPESGVFAAEYGPENGYNARQKLAVRRLICETLEAGAYPLGWWTVQLEGQCFWARAVRRGGAAAVCLVDAEAVAKNAQSGFALSSPVVLMQKGRVLTTALWVEKAGGVPAAGDGYSFAGAGKQYLVVRQPLLAGVEAVYGVPYRDNMGALGWLRTGPLLLLLAALAALAGAWAYLRRCFFRPLDDLVRTMERIRSNDLEARPGRYASREFAQVNETFNQMIGTITGLKIASYENRLAAEQAQMDALRMQIRPHFFLNCLKNIYGLAQAGQFKEIQSSILLLSTHLRYTFELETDVVPLEKELQMCENYVRLQAVGRALPPECRLDVPPGLLGLQVPPVSLLTLVENSVKHATVQDRPLRVTIAARQLPMEGGMLTDLTVQDNGPGFSPELLARLNKAPDELAAQAHVGLANVVRRFRLLYGERFAIRFASKGGACAEIMICPKGEEEV